MAEKKLQLPEPIPSVHAEPAELATWVSLATQHQVVATMRPGRGERGALTVRLEDGHELFFETVADACRPDRFISAFLAYDGVPMPNWSIPQVRQIVGAMVRMAQLTAEYDERADFIDAGVRYLRACLHNGGKLLLALGADTLEGRLDAYAVAAEYARLIANKEGAPGEPRPPVLVASDTQHMHVPRGLFLRFAQRTVNVTAATLNARMRSLGWVDVNLRPRQPGPGWERSKRPHLHLWQVPFSWANVGPDEPGIREVTVPVAAPSPGRLEAPPR